MRNLVHVVPFYGNPKPGAHVVSGVNYRSNDLRVIDRQLQLIQDYQYDGIIALWYGDVDPFINDACEKMCFLCEKHSMLFGLCVDPWAMGTAKATMTQVQKNDRWSTLLSLVKPFLASSAYLPERYIIDFATGADIPTVQKANPNNIILRTYNEVAWPKVSAGLDSKVNLIQQNATAIIPAVMHSFADYDPANPANSIWGGAARRIDAQDGAFELDVIKSIMATKGVAKYVQRVTWNDYHERTAIERQAIVQAAQLGQDVSVLL